MEQIVNAGYTIKEQVTIHGNTYVMGHNPNPNTPAPYVTWAANLNENYFVYGHYFADEASARANLLKRAMEHMPEQEYNSFVKSALTDELRSELSSEARRDVALADIEACLEGALENLDLDPDLTQKLLADERFVEFAMHKYYNVDHSFENEALTDTLESLVEDMFPELLNDKEPLQSFYYTFGTAEQFPHKRGWVEIRAEDRACADKLFRAHYPDKHPGILNCAFVYDKEQFDRLQEEVYKNLSAEERVCHNVISQYDPETGAPNVALTHKNPLIDQIQAAEGKRTQANKTKNMEKEPER